MVLEAVALLRAQYQQARQTDHRSALLELEAPADDFNPAQNGATLGKEYSAVSDSTQWTNTPSAQGVLAYLEDDSPAFAEHLPLVPLTNKRSSRRDAVTGAGEVHLPRIDPSILRPRPPRVVIPKAERGLLTVKHGTATAKPAEPADDSNKENNKNSINVKLGTAARFPDLSAQDRHLSQRRRVPAASFALRPTTSPRPAHKPDAQSASAKLVAPHDRKSDATDDSDGDMPVDISAWGCSGQSAWLLAVSQYGPGGACRRERGSRPESPHARSAGAAYDSPAARAERLIAPRAPAAVMSRSPRWPEPGAKRQRAKASQSPEAAQGASCAWKAGDAHPPSTQRTLNLEAAYRAILPAPAAPRFSTLPRFPVWRANDSQRGVSEGGESTAPCEQEGSSQGAQEQLEGNAWARLAHKRVRRRSAPVRGDEGNVLAALDYVKKQHIPAVRLDQPSVADELRRVIQQRRQQRIERELRLMQEAAVMSTAAGLAAEAAVVAGSQADDSEAPADTADSDADSRGLDQGVSDSTAGDQTLPEPAPDQPATKAAADAAQQGDTQTPAAPQGLTGAQRNRVGRLKALAAVRRLARAAEHVSDAATEQVDDMQRQLLAHSAQRDAESLPHYAKPLRRSIAALTTDPSQEESGVYEPNYAAVEKQSRAWSIAPLPATNPPPHQWSKAPGPGAYRRADDLPTLTSTLSTLTRPTATVFGSAPRYPSPTPAQERDMALMELAQLHRDPLAALDRTLPRVPAAVIPSATEQRAANDAKHTSTTQAPTVLEVSYDLVERRAAGALILPLHQHTRRSRADLTEAEEQRQAAALELQLALDPYNLDRAVRTHHPSWIISQSTDRLTVYGPEHPPVRPLYPNWDFIRPRTDTGIPQFSTFLNTRRLLDDATLAVERRQPAVGQYDLQAAYDFLQKHVPQVVMRFAQDRWRADLATALSQGGDQAILELSQAMRLVRPRAPTWTIAPPPETQRRVPAPRQRRGFGPTLSWDVCTALDRVKLRQGRGTVAWRQAEPLSQSLDTALAVTATGRVGPNTYDIQYRLVERRVPAYRFRTSLRQPHSSSDSLNDYTGLVENIDVAAALDRVMPRTRLANVRFGMMIGRERGMVGGEDTYGEYTRELSPLSPDKDLVLSQRPRPRQALITARPVTPTVPPDEQRRGPGTYDVSDDRAMGTQGPYWDFSRAQGHILDSPEMNPLDVREGRRLELSPNWDQLSYRPRAPVAVISGLQKHHAREVPNAPEDLYPHAEYDVNLNAVRPVPPRPVEWERGTDRFSPPKPPTGPPLDYHIEDIPLHRLAGHAAPKGVIEWAKQQGPRAPETPHTGEGDRLTLDPAAAFDALSRRQQGVPELRLMLGRDQQLPGQGDAELTAWVSYRPKLDLVKPSIARPVNMARGVPRKELQNVTEAGDLDGGVYNVKHTQVWPSAPEVPSWAASAHQPRLPDTSPDPDQGNALYLNPQQPEGWRPPLHADAAKQPFGLAVGRSLDGPTSEEGPQLYLDTKGDDIAEERRPTLPNAPAAVFGEAHRYAPETKPNDNYPPRQVYQPQSVQRMETSLLHEPPANKALELMQREPNNALVAAARRRERVWARIERRLARENADVQQHDAHRKASTDATSEQEGVGALPHLNSKPSAVGRKEWRLRKQLLPSAPRGHHTLRTLQEEHAMTETPVAPQLPAPVNRGGFFYVAKGPDAPPEANLPRPHAHLGGMFQDVRGAEVLGRSDAFPWLQRQVAQSLTQPGKAGRDVRLTVHP